MVPSSGHSTSAEDALFAGLELINLTNFTVPLALPQFAPRNAAHYQRLIALRITRKGIVDYRSKTDSVRNFRMQAVLLVTVVI